MNWAYVRSPQNMIQLHSTPAQDSPEKVSESMFAKLEKTTNLQSGLNGLDFVIFWQLNLIANICFCFDFNVDLTGQQQTLMSWILDFTM